MILFSPFNTLSIPAGVSEARKEDCDGDNFWKQEGQEETDKAEEQPEGCPNDPYYHRHDDVLPAAYLNSRYLIPKIVSS